MGDVRRPCEPGIRFRGEILEEILGEELRSDALFRRLIRDYLGTVLAKFENLPLLIRARPYATLAIQAGHVVDLQESFGGSYRTPVSDAIEHGVPDSGDAGGRFRGRSDPEVA